MAGIFTKETMNNLAGPQRKNGTRSRRAGALNRPAVLSNTIPNSLPMLELLSLLRPRGKNCQRKFFRPDTNPQRHPQHLCPRESRVDAIYEHIRRDASALERLGMRTAYCG